MNSNKQIDHKTFETEINKDNNYLLKKETKIFLEKIKKENPNLKHQVEFKKQDPLKFLVLPKRRADTNSVYSFGLKYSLSQEKHIVKDLKNENYFKFDIVLLKNRLANNPFLLEKFIKRILLNKNIKKQYAQLEKPFPFLNKISNCKGINKTDEFLFSLISNHKFDVDDEVLNELLQIRKNKKYEFNEKQNQNCFFSNTLESFNKNQSKNKNSQKIKLLEFNTFDFLKSRKFNMNNPDVDTMNENKETRDNVNNQENDALNHSFNQKNNKNKNEFFLINSNFSSLKNVRKYNKKKSLIVRKQSNLSQKMEQELIKSLEFERKKFEHQIDDFSIHENEIEKKEDKIPANNNVGASGNLNNSNSKNSSIIFLKNLPNINNISNFEEKSKKASTSNRNLILINNISLLNQQVSPRNVNTKENSYMANSNIVSSKNSHKKFNFNNEDKQNLNAYSSAIDDSFNKANKNLSTFNSNLLYKTMGNQKFTNREETKINEASVTNDFINFSNIYNNKIGNKTVSTENDFRKFNKNAINKIMSSKKNSEMKPSKIKPDFLRYKYPEEGNKPKDSFMEKIKIYADRKTKSSQIRSRVFGEDVKIIKSINDANDQNLNNLCELNNNLNFHDSYYSIISGHKNLNTKNIMRSGKIKNQNLNLNLFDENNAHKNKEEIKIQK